jgi:hypothetical protein
VSRDRTTTARAISGVSSIMPDLRSITASYPWPSTGSHKAKQAQSQRPCARSRSAILVAQAETSRDENDLVPELLKRVAAVCPLVERADSSKVGQPDLVWLCGYGLVQMICTSCCCWRASHSILAISMVAQSMWDTFPQLKNQTVYMIFLLEKLN